jgi:acyl-CoA thioester hydrolase
MEPSFRRPARIAGRPVTPVPETSRTRRPTRADYVAWRTATTRWRDDDAYGHLNNATYYELFDTAVNAYLYEATGVDVRALTEIGVVAETGCRYFREIGFPEPIEMGLVVDRVGTSSIVYRIGLFQGPSDEAAAEGRFVHVYVDNTSGPGQRPVRPLPDEIRAVVERLRRPTG